MARRGRSAFAENVEMPEKCRKLGIILDTEDEKTVSSFLDLKQDLKLDTADFHLVMCKERSFKNAIFDTPAFSLKDLSWNGRFSAKASAFLAAEYEVLISFTASENKMAHFLVSESRAHLKVGRKEAVKNDIFDLNISAAITAHEVFISELKKYLKILKPTA